MSNVLLVGGAGYVGSITCEELINKGYDVTVLDNLYQGYESAVHPKANFVKGDIKDKKFLFDLFEKNDFEGVMDFAGETLIEFSMTDPFRYFKANIVDGMHLLNAMVKYNVKKFIFSSTSAVYGEAQFLPITEEHPKYPENSYGESKYLFERILRWYYEIHGLKSACFRYFNASGASLKYGESHNPETHLIPLIIQVALGQRKSIDVFGNDYNTSDGTCIRDYTHVIDLAQGHILGYEKIDSICHDQFNLGYGIGYSVLEVINMVNKISKQSIPYNIVNRRPGDAAIMVADSNKVKVALDWKPKYGNLESIIESAWIWHKKNPNGYYDRSRY